MRFTKISLILASFILSTLAQGAGFNYTASLYEQGSDKKKLLYTLTVETSQGEGQKATVKSIYKDSEGNVAVEQNVQLEGNSIVRDEVQQKQLGQVGLIEIKDGKAYFSKTVDGKTSTKEEKLEETFVTAGNFHRFVKDHWDEILKGDTVGFRYGVWDRQETVGFKIFKNGEEKDGDKKIIVVKMKPSSFIIAAIVKPIIFKFPEDGAHVLELNGRVAPKRRDGEKWKDLDAEMVYAY